MAHCPFEKLSDIALVLESIRMLPAIKEKKPGIFYIGSQSFLHFHIKENRRWADARDGSGWGKEIEIPLGPNRLQTNEFMNEVIRRHSSVLKAKQSKTK
jgi:hypothetical protein